MILTRVVPPGDMPLQLDVPDDRAHLVELYRPERSEWLRLNLIGSVSGSAVGSDGTSESLTNPTDRLLLRVIRDLSDVVLVGAASVRAEGFGVPRHSALAVVTGSGDLSGHRIVTDGHRGDLVVLCPASAASRVRTTLGDTAASIIEVAADEPGMLAPAAIVAALRSAGYSSIACEGGPNLAAQLVDAGLVDEICLTLSPVLNGSALPIFGGTTFEERRLTLTQLLADEASGLYARWRLAGD